jgi:hypothetical protein
VAIKTTVVTGTLQVFGGSEELGTFVAVGPTQKRGLGWLPYISVGAILLAGVAGLLVRWREGKRKASQARKGRGASKSKPTSSSKPKSTSTSKKGPPPKDKRPR